MPPVEDPSDDDISVTSTVASQPQDEYEVESILAQRTYPTGEMYLVKWAGYPEERCTWEPESSFCDPRIMQKWRETARAIARGERSPFDVRALEIRYEAGEAARLRRKEKRRAKRTRLGIHASPTGTRIKDDSSSDLGGFTVNDAKVEEEEELLQSKRQKGKAKKRAVPKMGPLRRDTISSNDTYQADVVAESTASVEAPDTVTSATIANSRSPEQPSVVPGKPLTMSGRDSPAPFETSIPAKPQASLVHSSTSVGSLPHSSRSSHGQSFPAQASSQQPSRRSVSTRPVLTIKTPQPNLEPTVSPTTTPQDSKETGPHLPRTPSQKVSRSLAAGMKARQQKAKSAAGPLSPSDKVFRNLSTKRRYEKASQREPTPDIGQLDLRKPGEWLKRQKQPSPTARHPPSGRGFSESDSLFVEQDSPMDVPPDEPGAPVHRQHEFVPETARINQAPWQPGGQSYQRNPGDLSRRSSIESPREDRRASVTRAESTPYSPDSDKSKSLARMPGTRVTMKKRFWQPGEILATLHFGPEKTEIGDVRFCNLNLASRRQLLSLKSQVVINIWFRDVCNIDEYRLLCETGFNSKYATGWIVGFDDTAGPVNDMAQYLRERRLAALWYHPQGDVETVMIAYASASSDWDFFNTDATLPPTANLRVVVRGFLPPLSSIKPALVTGPPVKSNVPTRDDQLKTTELAQTDPPKDTNMADAEPLPVNASNIDIVAIFREQFDISIEELSIVNSDKKDNVARSFYLYFPEEVNDEFELVKHFLEKHNMVIFSNRLEGDWERFARTMTNGTILFHQEFIFYENMPHLHHLLRKPMNVFNISLSKPIDHLNYKTHIQRLFPHGGVILMTEDYMVREAKNALKVLKWFGHYLDTKFPGTWKMFFRPNVQQWLLDLAMTWVDDTVWQMYCQIKYLIPDYPFNHYNSYRRPGSPHSLDGRDDSIGQHHPFISMRRLPDYGFRSEDDNPDIPKGLTQEERNADHMAEYFAGWGLVKSDQFRRFVMLTTFKPQPRWVAWQHLEVMNTEKFFKTFVTKTDGSTRGSESGDKASKSRRQRNSNLPSEPPAAEGNSSETVPTSTTPLPPPPPSAEE